jgi:hypothetical protein
LRQVGIYDARYGHLQRWELAGLLDRLAGGSVDLAHERCVYAEMLRTGRSEELADVELLTDIIAPPRALPDL